MTQPSILGRWYADPLSSDEARQLLEQTEQREEKRKRHCGNTLTCKLQRMVALFWLGEEVNAYYQILRPLAARSPHGHALLELIYGQLLLSSHLKEGLMHLEQGFRLAAKLFTARDYLDVMNRHRLLRQLPLSDTPTHADPLSAMLTSAKVIERMKQPENKRQPYFHDPKDTYG